MASHVFITDGHWRKTLAAVRSLGRQGACVTVGESTRLATALFSGYRQRALVYPSPVFDPSGFLSYLLDELSHRSYHMLLPMEDVTIDCISRHAHEFSQKTYLPIAPREKLLLAWRKDKTLRAAQKLGIPTPKTWFIKELSEVETLKRTLPYPVVIKPRTGSGAIGIVYCKGPDRLTAQYKSVHKRFPFPLIQERIPESGTGYGVSFLMDETSRVKAFFAHKRLREYPVTGGASTLRESVRRDDLRELGFMLLKALGWFGVAMVEFKVDPRDNVPKLMEINPRFWGSLSLAIESGVDFPNLLLKMARGEHFRPVERYQIGKQCRWLLPGDILHFIHNPDRLKLAPSFFRFFNPNVSYDILSLGDPLPVLARLLMPLTLFYDADMKERLHRRKS